MNRETKEALLTAADMHGLSAEFLKVLADAERYRFLREQHWSTGKLCVVMDPKDAVKLGHTCLSGEHLDIVVDDAILIGRAVDAA